MRVLPDTNVLLRAVQPGHPQHAAADGALAALLAQRDVPVLVPQAEYEFWVVATRPVAANGLGLSPAEAAADLARYEALMPLLPDPPGLLPVWKQLVLTYAVLGKKAHDARLVAAMHVHGITHILTFNGADLARFPGITVLTPAGVVGPPPTP